MRSVDPCLLLLQQAGDVLTPQEQALSLKNVCPLPLSLVLSLGQPFSICDVERQPLPAGVQVSSPGPSCCWAMKREECDAVLLVGGPPGESFVLWSQQWAGLSCIRFERICWRKGDLLCTGSRAMGWFGLEETFQIIKGS